MRPSSVLSGESAATEIEANVSKASGVGASETRSYYKLERTAHSLSQYLVWMDTLAVSVKPTRFANSVSRLLVTGDLGEGPSRRRRGHTGTGKIHN
jgi:hypothetical protein